MLGFECTNPQNLIKIVGAIFEKIEILILYTLLNVAPKPTDQIRWHSTSWVPLQIYPARFYRFRSTLKIKDSSRKKKKRPGDICKGTLNIEFEQD